MMNMAPTFLICLLLFLPLFGLGLNLAMVSRQRWHQPLSLFISGLYFFLISDITWVHSSSNYPLIQVGNWPISQGISLGFHPLSVLFLWITGLIYFAACLYSKHGVTAENSPYFFPLLHGLFFGLTGAFLTYDLFNLFVWFEITLISSFGLFVLESHRYRITGTLKYILLSFISSLIFLISIGLIYAHTGSLDMNQLTDLLKRLSDSKPLLVTGLGIFIALAFAIKSALFPFYVWLPASYTHISPALGGIFAGLMTKLGLYSLMRVNGLIFPYNEKLMSFILISSCLTMLIGVWGAIIQTHIRKILIFHTISQIGYMATSVVFISHPDQNIKTLGIVASLFYILQYIPLKTNLFFISGLIKSYLGSENLEKLFAIRSKLPWIALLFGVSALTLIGVPPSSGFWAKFSLVQATLEGEYYLTAFTMILVSFFTMYSMTKIWSEGFWGDILEEENSQGVKLNPHTKNYLPLCACTLLLLAGITFSLNPDILREKITDSIKFTHHSMETKK